jgi:hypothetical protein
MCQNGSGFCPAALTGAAGIGPRSLRRPALGLRRLTGALPTTADIAGWVVDPYRERVPHVHELLAAWQALAPP